MWGLRKRERSFLGVDVGIPSHGHFPSSARISWLRSCRCQVTFLGCTFWLGASEPRVGVRAPVRRWRRNKQYRDLPIRKYSKGVQTGGMAPLTSLPPLTRIHPQDGIWFHLGHFVPFQIWSTGSYFNNTKKISVGLLSQRISKPLEDHIWAFKRTVSRSSVQGLSQL